MKIAIRDIGYVGNLGDGFESFKNNLSERKNGFSPFYGFSSGPVRSKNFEKFNPKHKGFHRLDKVTKLALFAANQLKPKMVESVKPLVAIGSSRGATGIWESAHQHFLQTGNAGTLDSPLTTSGHLASHVGSFLQTSDYIDLDQSITCSSGMRALADACVWIQSGMVNDAIAGGSEAPLTPFTVAQMDAIGVLGKHQEWPCRALDKESTQNSMVLSEGAVLFHLSRESGKDTKGFISGFGFSAETGNSFTGISPEGLGFQETMKKAVDMAGWEKPDLIIAHAPGTIKGDAAELKAIHRVWGDIPVTSSKFLTGHMFGASGPMSVMMGLAMMELDTFVSPDWAGQKAPKKRNKILVNAIGFGANAVSLAIEK